MYALLITKYKGQYANNYFTRESNRNRWDISACRGIQYSVQNKDDCCDKQSGIHLHLWSHNTWMNDFVKKKTVRKSTALESFELLSLCVIWWGCLKTELTCLTFWSHLESVVYFCIFYHMRAVCVHTWNYCIRIINGCMFCKKTQKTTQNNSDSLIYVLILQ